MHRFEGLNTANAQQLGYNQARSEDTYVTFNGDISPESTEKSKKFIVFYCDHYELGPPQIDESKTPPGQPNAHFTSVIVPGVQHFAPIRAKARGTSKAESRGHCFNHVAQLLKARHPELIEKFEYVLTKNPHSLENLVNVEFTSSHRERVQKLLQDLHTHIHLMGIIIHRLKDIHLLNGTRRPKDILLIRFHQQQDIKFHRPKDILINKELKHNNQQPIL